jgi:hypothetical protein
MLPQPLKSVIKYIVNPGVVSIREVHGDVYQVFGFDWQLLGLAYAPQTISMDSVDLWLRLVLVT